MAEDIFHLELIMTNDITINLRQAFLYISNKGKYIVEF